mmetsp:Transcript_105789/g.329789  ORF Transcript_105789/g.329789 Transcript_105789/m.329789 type:complete len:420 (+) Transcript_105789:837-2096(+)
MLAVAVVRLARRRVQLCAAIVVVGVPQPHMVQHHVVAVDLHHRVRPHELAPAVLEAAHPHEDVRSEPRGGARQGVLLARLRAPLEQRLRRLVAHRRAGLDQQTRHAHLMEAVGDLDSWATVGGDQRGPADAEDDKVVVLDLDRHVELIDPRRHQESLHPLHAVVNLRRGHPRPGDEDLVVDVQLPAKDVGGCPDDVADKLRNVDEPRTTLRHQEGLLRCELLPERHHLARHRARAALLGRDAQAAHADEDVVPAGRAIDLAPKVNIAEEPLLLCAHGQGPVHPHVRHEAAGGVPLAGREAQAVHDGGPPDGRRLRDGPSDLLGKESHALHGTPEVVRGVPVGAVWRLHPAQPHLAGRRPDAYDAGVVRHLDPEAVLVLTRHQQQGISVLAEVRVVLYPEHLIHDGLVVVVLRVQDLDVG